MRPTSVVSRALPALLTAGVVGIVLGIVGMHALSIQGVMSDTDHTTMTQPMTEHPSDSQADMSADPVASNLVGPTATVPTADSGGDNGHGMGDMMMLCAAMLAAAATTLLLLLALTQRIPRSWTVARSGITVRVTRWLLPTGTGPPALWEFSVIRC